jgi:hypothetical protein
MSQMPAYSAAVSYIERGWAVIPIGTNKMPNSKVLTSVYGNSSWKPLTQRPASRPEVREWFAADPTTGIGILCGEPSAGLVVADFDTMMGVALPPTPTVLTGRGRHSYFTDPTVTTSTAYPWGDLKGSGYVVAPPTRHQSGRGYTWLVSPDDVDPAPLPVFPATTSAPSRGMSSPREPRRDISPWFARGFSETEGRPDFQEGLAVWDAFGPYIEALARACGWRVCGAFTCTIHGDQKSRSAALYRTDSGRWVYKCFHRGAPTYSLTQAFTAFVTREDVGDMPNATQIVWKLRALQTTGFLAAEPVLLPELPARATACTRKLYLGIQMLFALKWAWPFWTGDATTITRRFMASWTGMSEGAVERAKGELLQAGVIMKVGMHRRASLYLPGPSLGDAQQ